MTIEDALYYLLSGASGITTLVSGRIFQGELPETITGGYPVILYRPKGDKSQVRTLEGGCALMEQTFQFWSVGRKSTDGGKKRCALLDDAVFALLCEYQGTVTDLSSPVNTLDIQNAEPEICHLYDAELARRGNEDLEACAYLSEFRFYYLDPSRQQP